MSLQDLTEQVSFKCPKCGVTMSPDFDSMPDAPMFGAEHPDYPAALEALRKWRAANFCGCFPQAWETDPPPSLTKTGCGCMCEPAGSDDRVCPNPATGLPLCF